MFFLESYGEFRPTSFDKPSVALCSLGLLSLLYGLSSITSAEVIALPIVLIIVGIILLTFFVRRQLKLEVPLLKVSIFARAITPSQSQSLPAFKLPWLVRAFCCQFTCRISSGISALETGIVVASGRRGGAILGFFAGRWFDRFGPRKVIIPCAFILLLGGCGLIAIFAGYPNPFIIAVYTCLSVGITGTMLPSIPGASTHSITR